MRSSIIVQNLKCNGCATSIINSLSLLDYISEVDVDIEESKISFNTINDEDALMVKEKLKNLGYPSIDDVNSFTSKAKSFVSCATGKMSN